ncbi:MAG: TIGR04086 family membrane protein [Bacillota bacterium]|jgi:putative membrane protein (TIGR04086 family)|nr:TIGR04086 family membrane protein [Candidatus Fermentithermobacillaceae bacterium]
MKYSPPGKPGYPRWSQRHKVEEGFLVSLVGKGVGYALFMAVLLILLASAVVYLTRLEESIVYWVVNIGSFAILGLASFITARRARRHGLVYGVAIGASYAIITVLVGAILYPPFIGVGALLRRIGFCVLAGACGGVLGVNY